MSTADSQITHLLDTCVLSEIIKPLPEVKVVNWLVAHSHQYTASMVTFAELNFGVHLLASSKRKIELSAWIEQLRAEFGNNVLQTTEEVWQTHASIKAHLVRSGKRIDDDLDLLIAATAKIHKLILVTRNTKHFEKAGVALFNPWD